MGGFFAFRLVSSGSGLSFGDWCSGAATKWLWPARLIRCRMTETCLADSSEVHLCEKEDEDESDPAQT
jgi:hypothetical protein